MWIKKREYKYIIEANASLAEDVRNLEKELKELKPKPKLNPCEDCGIMTDYIPIGNIKFCKYCEGKRKGYSFGFGGATW